ncbi:hypothetical protein ILYODFUR_011577 [Ilyodon furcidens]|uniref:Uncharacterized protein n=1 Tax=Ilyodon furcidens TaxID=33524 RepID=A0ABV0SNT6_9TELE
MISVILPAFSLLERVLTESAHFPALPCLPSLPTFLHYTAVRFYFQSVLVGSALPCSQPSSHPCLIFSASPLHTLSFLTLLCVLSYFSPLGVFLSMFISLSEQEECSAAAQL